ncbi:hypothetical protein ABZY68_25685 [Streptomyces sp. NPDC006482]|uniref:hypothetical protein n=1 Tax=Streptomyces sp. NPDC006482 TaxID=3154306 RepID=UPI0033BCC86D
MDQQPHDDQAADREQFTERAVPRPPRPRQAQPGENWDTALARAPRQRGHDNS